MHLASCHRCGHPFGGAPVGGAGNPMAGDDSTDWRNEMGWDAAYRGLLMYRYGLITYVVTVFASYVLLVMVAVAQSPTLAMALILGVGISLLAAHGMMVAGQHRFSSIPPNSGAKGLAMAGFVGGLVALVLAVIGLLFALGGTAKGTVSAASGLGSLSWVVGSICFILAMAGVARHVDSPQLGRQAMVVLVLLVLFLAFGMGYEYLAYKIKAEAAASGMSTRVSELQGLGIFVLVPWAAIGVFFLFKFLQLLTTLTAILGEAALDVDPDEDEDLSY